MGITDIIGGRGQAIAATRLTRICRDDNVPYFWPQFLGDKCPLFDFLVELLGAADPPPFFFVQVKTSQKALTRKEKRLRGEVDGDDVRKMSSYLAPAYVVGVYEPEERAFVISVHRGMHGRISSITTAHELTCDTLHLLWEEVKRFWEHRDMTRTTSRFLNWGSAMANESKKGYLADQVQARAVVVLTRRSDLTIVETRKDTGLDFHVYIERDDRAMRLMFGVLLRGIASPVTPQTASALLQPTMAQFAGMGKFLYPVCLLFFTMREEQEFFAWLAEPVQTSGGPKLVHHQQADCVELTGEVLDDAVERIVAWYDAVQTVLVA